MKFNIDTRACFNIIVFSSASGKQDTKICAEMKDLTVNEGGIGIVGNLNIDKVVLGKFWARN